MTRAPLVSIIIPTFNRENTILRSINSIINQTYKNIEIIVVDDASNDSTDELIKTIDDERLVYIHNKKNLGVAQSRNMGVQASHGEYLAFNDSDDIWVEDKLELQMKVFETYKNCELCYCSYILQKEDGVVQYPRKTLGENKLNGRIYQHLLRENWIGTPTIVISRKAFINVGGFNSKLRALDDWDLVIKVSRLYDVRFLNEILVYAGYSPDGITAKGSNKLYHIQAIIEIIKENIEWNKNTDNLDVLYERLMGRLMNLTNDELEECKSPSMSYIFNFKSVSDRIISDIKIINGLKKTVLRYEEKYSVLHKLFEKNRCMNILSAYLKENNIHAVAIYGYGDIGKILISCLEELDITIDYIVDKNIGLNTPYLLIQPDDEIPKVDLLIISIIDNEFKTTGLMKSKLDGYVVRLQDLL